MLNIAYVSAIIQIMRRSVFITVLLLFCLVTTVHSEYVTYDKFVVTPAVINGRSMEPTLHNGQIVLVLNDDLARIQRGDIVAAYMKCGTVIEFVAKRIVAVPGDTIYGQVLPPDTYWIEGDNKEHSIDSRKCGPITRSQIKGVIIRY